MHQRTAAGLSALLAILFAALAGCDLYPTQAIDRSVNDIQFRWRHKDYPDWSSWVPIPAGKSALLARGHYVADFLGIEVDDAGHHYAIARPQMDAFRHICARAPWGQCWVVDEGSGRFNVQPHG